MIVVSDAALVDDPFLAELESDARYRDLMARLRLPIRSLRVLLMRGKL